MRILTTKKQKRRILALDPFWRGFGFAVLEGADELIDWGLKISLKPNRTRILNQVGNLLTTYKPDIVLIEDLVFNQRNPRVKDLMADIVELARAELYQVETLSRREIRNFFIRAGSKTRFGIAKQVAAKFPELNHKLPPARKPWMKEDRRLHVFVAVSLALTFFG